MAAEMEISKSWTGLLLAGVLMGLMSTSAAYNFYVGGRAGWVQNPSEGYNQWAARMRFQVGDTLVFKYKKGEDSVLVVKKEDYDSCNVSNPMQRLDGGDSVFKFDRSGPFYFISGAPGHCGNGQKLNVVVLAVRNKPSPPPASSPPSLPPSPSPTSKPPTSSPAPSPSSPPSPPSPSPSPSSPSPSPSPSPVPSPHANSPSPSPSPSPIQSPSPAPTPSSNQPPSPSPSPSSLSSPSPSPEGAGVSPPAQTPTLGSPPESGPPPASSPSSPSSNKPSSSPVLTVSGVSFGLVALVLGGAFLC